MNSRLVIPAERAQRASAGIHNRNTHGTITEHPSPAIVIMDAGLAANAAPRNDESWSAR
jgi:hypothetical protein